MPPVVFLRSSVMWSPSWLTLHCVQPMSMKRQLRKPESPPRRRWPKRGELDYGRASAQLEGGSPACDPAQIENPGRARLTVKQQKPPHRRFFSSLFWSPS